MPKFDAQMLLALGKITTQQTFALKIVQSIHEIERTISEVRGYNPELTHDYLMGRYENLEFLKTSIPQSGNASDDLFLNRGATAEMFVRVGTHVVDEF